MADNYDEIMNLAEGTPIDVGDLEGWTSTELESLYQSLPVGSTSWYSALSAINVYGGTEYTSGGAFDLFEQYAEDTWETYTATLPDTMDWQSYFYDVLEEGGYNAYSLYSTLSEPLNTIDQQLHPEKYDFDNFSISNVGDALDNAITGTADLIGEGVIQPFTYPLELGLDLVGLDEEAQLVSDLAGEGVDIISETLEPVIEGITTDVIFGTSGVFTIEGGTEAISDFDDVLEQNLNEAGDIIKDYLGTDESGGETGYDFNIPSLDDAGSVYDAGQRYGRRETIYSDLPTNWKDPIESRVHTPSASNDYSDILGGQWTV